MSDYQIVVDTFGFENKDRNVRGTVKVEAEEFPRKFVYYRTRRYMRERGVDEACGTPAPAAALRTNPPNLEQQVARRLFVQIFNEISDCDYAARSSPEALLEESDENWQYFVGHCRNVTISDDATQELRRALAENRQEANLKNSVADEDTLPF